MAHRPLLPQSAAEAAAASDLSPVFPRELYFPNRWERSLYAQGVPLPFASLPRSFIDILASLKCSVGGCTAKFSSADNEAAFTAHCSHLFCKDHAKPKFGLIDGRSTRGFDCPLCSEPYHEIDFNKFIPPKSYFTKERVLAARFAHLESGKGFRCIDCGQLHPRLNMVECTNTSCKSGQPSSSNASQEPRQSILACVWCANKNHSLCTLQMLREDHEPSSRRTEKEWLRSYDWTDHEAWSLLHCAVCWNLLEYSKNPTTTDAKEERQTPDGDGAHSLDCLHAVCKGYDHFYGYPTCTYNEQGEMPCDFCGRSALGAAGSLNRICYQNRLRRSVQVGEMCEICKFEHPKDNLIITSPKRCYWCNLTCNARVLRSLTEGDSKPEGKSRRRRDSKGGMKREDSNDSDDGAGLLRNMHIS